MYTKLLSEACKDLDWKQLSHQSLIQSLLMHSTDAIALTDTNANIVFINEAFEKHTGYSKEELIHQNMRLLKSDRHKSEFYKSLWETLTNGDTWEGELINKDKYGNDFIDKTLIIPIINDELQTLCYLTIRKNITESKLQEDLYRKHIREAQMSSMLPMIAHQWKQPLAALSASNISLLVKSQLSSLEQDDIEKVCTQNNSLISSMVDTINDFRNFYTPSQDKRDMNIKELIEETITFMHSNILRANICVISNNSNDIRLKSYKNELKQVFINLIQNFIDIVQKSDIKQPQLKIDVTENDEDITITFEDNGGGIKQKNLQSIFKQYITSKKEDDGTGLGLYMSKLVIEEHCQGTISVKNSDEGAIFTIVLPKLISKAEETLC